MDVSHHRTRNSEGLGLDLEEGRTDASTNKKASKQEPGDNGEVTTVETK